MCLRHLADKGRLIQGLAQQQVRSILDFLQEITAAQDLHSFRMRAARALPGLAPCDLTYNDLDLVTRSIAWTANAPDRLLPGAIEIAPSTSGMLRRPCAARAPTARRAGTAGRGTPICSATTSAGGITTP